jgi:hypothetical protein
MKEWDVRMGCFSDDGFKIAWFDLSLFRRAEWLKNNTWIVIHHPLCILTAKTC